MNYIDLLAWEIAKRSEGESFRPTEWDMPLYRIYAVLARTKGTATTLEDVHDAWSAWCAQDRPEHPSIVPFSELTPDVQAMDQPYVDAIHAVAEAA